MKAPFQPLILAVPILGAASAGTPNRCCKVPVSPCLGKSWWCGVGTSNTPSWTPWTLDPLKCFLSFWSFCYDLLCFIYFYLFLSDESNVMFFDWMSLGSYLRPVLCGLQPSRLDFWWLRCIWSSAPRLSAARMPCLHYCAPGVQFRINLYIQIYLNLYKSILWMNWMEKKGKLCAYHMVSNAFKCKDGGVEPTNSLFSFDLEVPASFQLCAQWNSLASVLRPLTSRQDGIFSLERLCCIIRHDTVCSTTDQTPITDQYVRMSYHYIPM